MRTGTWTHANVHTTMHVYIHMHTDKCTALLGLVWVEATTRNYDIWSNRPPLMFPAYTLEFLPAHRITPLRHVCASALMHYIRASYSITSPRTCVLRLRDSTLGVHQCTNWKQLLDVQHSRLLLDHRTLPEHRYLLQGRTEEGILETGEFLASKLELGREKGLRGKYGLGWENMGGGLVRQT